MSDIEIDRVDWRESDEAEVVWWFVGIDVEHRTRVRYASAGYQTHSGMGYAPIYDVEIVGVEPPAEARREITWAVLKAIGEHEERMRESART